MSTAQDQAAAELPVVVIGAGPIGLAAAAHLVERGLEPLVLEAGDSVGAAIQEWGHVRLFSPWEFDTDAAARRLLEPTGWTAPPAEVLPTGAELVRDYLAPLAATAQLAPRIRTNTRAVAVSRRGIDKTRTIGREDHPLFVRTIDGEGFVRDIEARAIIDASGTWGRANPLGDSGLAAVGEADAAPYLTGALPDVLGRDRARFAGKHALVVGMGHSAANTLLSLVELAEAEPGTRVTWAVRGASVARLYGGGDADGLPARGALGSRVKQAVQAGVITLVRSFTITKFEVPDGASDPVEVVGSTPDGTQRIAADVVVAATGFRPDLDMLREVRLEIDASTEAPVKLAPMIDPNFHSCGTVPPHGENELAHPEKDFYIAGMKSYGRAPTFLMATGYEQVRSIVAAIAGDREAADNVELELPETGVCSTNLPGEDEAGGCGSSCGTTAEPVAVQPVAVSSCGSGAEAGPSSCGTADAPVAEAGSCCGSSAPEPVKIGVGFATGLPNGLAGAIERGDA
ncbi:FAD-dependent oxidoreductase [Yinghuangia seranimata]|uniref:FAD-dependent oxidoreductase n=1 Tax=Yinghuangia seranimata TaxID=408067 RepID=UPI00248C8147|nr:FAD-dependent oxidoreductase [Yinghuangia seranimata]MDI2130159.1 NAD(P)-binding domain-containing protein [Yinghuangia seranimata]